MRWIDHRPGTPRQTNKEWQTAEVIIHQSDRRAVDCHFASSGAHRNPDIARGQSGRVIHAIANHRHSVSAGFHLANKFNLILGQAFGHNFFAPDFFCHARGHGLAISRNH